MPIKFGIVYDAKSSTTQFGSKCCVCKVLKKKKNEKRKKKKTEGNNQNP